MPDQDKPTPISFDLDGLEREGAPGPFVTHIGGRRIQFVDANEVDWQTIETLDSDRALYKLVIPEEDQEHFFAQKIPMWKIQALARAYRDHFGMGTAGNAVASSR